MCNLGEVIARENMAKGRAEGIAKGVVASIKNLMKNTGWSTEQAMTTLGVPEPEQEVYLKLLAE